MTKPHIIELTGLIGHVFAHRFVIQTRDGDVILADLGPKGAEMFRLEIGNEVVVGGEMRPSELKVVRIALKGHASIDIEHRSKPRDAKLHDGARYVHDAKPDVVVHAIRGAGFETIGVPRRKPKHFEVLARSGHAYLECHVEFDGHIRKEKIVSSQDPKWADDISASA